MCNYLTHCLVLGYHALSFPAYREPGYEASVWCQCIWDLALLTCENFIGKSYVGLF